MSRNLLAAVDGINFVQDPFPRAPNPDFRLDEEGMPADPSVERYLNPVHPLLTNPFNGTVAELLEALGKEDEVVVDTPAFARLVMLANSHAQPPLHAGSGALLKNSGAYLMSPGVQIPVFGAQVIIDDGDAYVGMSSDGPARLSMEEWVKIFIKGIEDRTEIALNSGDTHLITQAMVSAVAGMRLGAQKREPKAVDLVVGPGQSPIQAALGQLIQEVQAGDFALPGDDGLTPDMIEVYPL